MENIQTRSRFSSVDWFNELREVTVGGVGTIGSHLSLLLSRGGDHTILMYDDDEVDIYNLSGQLFKKNDVGKKKVEVIKDLMMEFSDFSEQNIHSMDSRIEKGTYVSPVCFSCFDNMKARKEMFENWKKLDTREIFIDGRMTIESYEVYCVTPENEKKYEKTLFSDEEVPEQICSLKNTTHTGYLVAARMMTFFTNHLTNSRLGIPMREVPFKFYEEMQSTRIDIS